MGLILRSIFGDLPLKIIAILIGVLIWFLASIERSYQIALKVPVKVSNPDSGYVLTNLPPQEANVSFTGKGSRLIDIKTKIPEIFISLKNRRRGIHQIGLTRKHLRPEPAPDVVISFNPNRIRLQIAREYHRYVDLKIPVAGKPEDGYVLASIEGPKRVLISGAKDQIIFINRVSTETLSLNHLKNKIDTNLRIILPSPIIKAFPESVLIVVDIEEVAETTLIGLKIDIEKGAGQKVLVNPSAATIRIRGPKSRIGSIRLEDIKVKIKTDKLKPGKFELPAQISLPPKIDLVESNPKLFRVNIR
ncbi:MAG TPA: hypothetical protein EYP24_00310 [bacterium (Candidatus Stahlbacteria)]|nr:hypothetical protein [Candidatus Stahlbacteria bacterium]